ncbi:MAG: leucine dehydrogenase [Paenibacillaceae bacterium]|jgi:leucine dehydrogenase|nr:leucine dehydrogenase [Paenibacillaceae bacterium]
MNLFEVMEQDGYEELVFCQDRESGLKAVIAIHDTTLGPALGGTRMWNYASEQEAIVDVLRLAKGMTYKNSAAGLNLGGGKTVIIGDPKLAKSERMFRAFGRFVQGLNGRYITAEDVGTSVADMEIVSQETDFVAGLSQSHGSSGDPSPATAFGVYRGMKAAAREVYGTDSLEGRIIAVQGVGHVGYYLCKHLYEEGARLIVTDLDGEAVRRVREDFQAAAVSPEDIYDAACDIYAPCALGATVNDTTIPRLRAKIIAGAANNQLKELRHGQMLHELGILYAPDYVINAGGVINIANEQNGYQAEQAYGQVAGIQNNLAEVFRISKAEGIPPHAAADRMALDRLNRYKEARGTHLRSKRTGGGWK